MNLLRPVSPHVRIVAALAAAAMIAGACTSGPSAADLRFEGPEDDTLVNAAELEELTFTVTTTEEDGYPLEDLRLLLDGEDVTADASVQDDTLSYSPGELPDGERSVVVAETDDAAEDEGAEPEPIHEWPFTVKADPPTVELTSPDGAVTPGDPVTVAGTTEADAEVAVGDQGTTADSDGTFELEVTDVAEQLTVTVTDVAGNTTEVTDAIVFVASRVEVEEVRTVHATFWAWETARLREPIVEMIEDGRINSLQLDLKDEGGHIGYESQVPLAQEIGADIGPLDLEQTVADLHDRDVAVIGRIVAFADPTLAEWAWANDRRDMVLQVPDGSDYYRGSYAGFSNFTDQDVIDYLLDLAEEAAQAGVDHILWDYIRRPEGMDNYTVPGLETTPEEAIVEFTRQADERLAPYGIQHGASVYGIAADRPEQIGQDIPAMAEHLDYMAPMIYPSHWGPGEYDVADPNRQPYDIIRATLEVWDEATAGTRARIVPWLEDTPYRAWDRPHQVREQIRAARDHGIDEWLMWNPGSSFTPAAYEPRD
ncbi:MAG: putative glycoside hydrolase [Nitriliruptor sp.]